jgi:hypothetical protein
MKIPPRQTPPVRFEKNDEERAQSETSSEARGPHKSVKTVKVVA